MAAVTAKNSNNAENQVWGRIAARHASGLENWDAE